MKVLLVGGSGMVGTFVTPYLAAHHELRVLDLRPPRHPDLVDYVEGSITDPDAIARALEGMDTFIDMVMRPVTDAMERHGGRVSAAAEDIWTAPETLAYIRDYVAKTFKKA